MTNNSRSTLQLIDALQSGQLTSRQLTEQCLEQIERQNPTLNAFLSVQAAEALQQADEIDQRRMAGQPVGSLQGLPIALKDNICTKGRPTTCGSRMLQNFVPPYDANVTERIFAADGVIVGKLNMDEFAMGSTTETSYAGSARNPWKTNHTAGGSSGGSAVAVAAGMVPLALGSDTGGSIRQPAGFCGVVGMKPTYGRVSRYGLVAYASSLDQIGPLARDAYGAAILYDVIARHDPRDATSLNDSEFPANTAVQHIEDCRRKSGLLTGLRIGVVDEHFGDGLSAEVRDRVQSAIESLKQSGATVHNVSLPHSKYSIAAYYLIACSEASSNLARYDGIHYGHRAEKSADMIDLYCQSRGESFGAEVKRRIMLGTFALSAGYYDAYYLKALKVRRRISEDFMRAFAEVDVIASPVAPTAAFELGTNHDDPLAMYLSDIYTISANLAGIPGISIPCGLTSQRLPVGLQLMTATRRDPLLFQVADQFQQLTDWHRATPGP
ncbi:MAG: Asp-tRNA(Asn)/Glu-tRNA(Gln) amidotransferase subunit GatA [Planctomycetaceae bacterium]|nr:Asp-tRNA(Asn)/Glu-tRNA(Gln) amidotransferase subunit GatA [Planctomycetaceae bacterium]